MAKSAPRACIVVLAGTNGSGKSSVLGATIRKHGAHYFNPDEATRRIREKNPGCSLAVANSEAWHHGKRLLEQAIQDRIDFAFETTLGGNTIPRLLEQAIQAGLDVCIRYVGLANPELHIARVQARVARGGHDIPADKIRERYEKSRINLIRLLPVATDVEVYDNSAAADPGKGQEPNPILVVRVERGKVVAMCPPVDVPDWAKPIVAAVWSAK